MFGLRSKNVRSYVWFTSNCIGTSFELFEKLHLLQSIRQLIVSFTHIFKKNQGFNLDIFSHNSYQKKWTEKKIWHMKRGRVIHCGIMTKVRVRTNIFWNGKSPFIRPIMGIWASQMFFDNNGFDTKFYTNVDMTFNKGTKRNEKDNLVPTIGRIYQLSLNSQSQKENSRISNEYYFIRRKYLLSVDRA